MKAAKDQPAGLLGGLNPGQPSYALSKRDLLFLSLLLVPLL